MQSNSIFIHNSTDKHSFRTTNFINKIKIIVKYINISLYPIIFVTFYDFFA